MMIGILITLLLVPVAICNQLPQTWTYQVYRNDDVTLYCNDSYVDMSANEYGEWTIPSGLKLPKMYNNSMHELKQENGIHGYALVVKNVNEHSEGVYTCTVKDVVNNHIRVSVIRGINLYQPLYKTSLEQYEIHIIVAVVAAVVFFVPFVSLCVIYKFRYRTNEDKAKKMNVRHTEYPNNVSMEAPIHYEEKVPPPDNEQFAYDNEASTNL